MCGTLQARRRAAHRAAGRAAIAGGDGSVAAGIGAAYLHGMDDATTTTQPGEPAAKPSPERPKEIGGPKGPEPTRYGDWEVNGRCSDF